VLTVPEVTELDKTFVHQGIEEVVQSPKTNTHILGYFTLRHIGVGLQQPHDPKLNVFMGGGLAA
jgi:hypothetical protein